MFTGLIEEVGTIAAVETSNAGSRISVSASTVLQNARLGDSIAVDGACMTVVELSDNRFSFEVSPESLSKTNFSTFKPGKRVNLERPLTPESRIGGHYVTGHVDGLARVVSVEPQGNSFIYTFEADSPDLAELLVSKGSVAVLGISLTVNTVCGNRFSVAIIPHTLTHTNLADYQPGDRVNIETDLLGKYVRRLLFERQDTSPSESPSHTPPVELEPALVPAMESLGVSVPASGARIRSGGWFNHDPEQD